MRQLPMLHPLLNNFNIAILRQAIIGLALGLITIIFLSFILGGNTPHYDSTLTFDSEVITLNKGADADKVAEAVDDTNAIADPNFSNADKFPYFGKNRAQLTSTQTQAIADNTPRVSIILGSMGQSTKMLDTVIDKMPQDVTIGLSPYSPDYNAKAKRLSNYGYETWMDIAAIRLKEHSDRGNMALNPVSNFEHNITLLDAQLDNKDKITGVILPRQALITETSKLWAKIVYELFAEGYGILDNTAGIMRPSLYFLDDTRAPYIKGDVTLENDMTLAEIKDALSTARKNILDQGTMIITLPEPTPATLDLLIEWINSLQSDGILLVPLSAQAKL